MHAKFPAVLSIDEQRLRNPVRQIADSPVECEGVLATFSRGRLRGYLFRESANGREVLIVPRSKGLPEGHERVLRATPAGKDPEDLSAGIWLRHPLALSASSRQQAIQQVLDSWVDALSLVEEKPEHGVKGFRLPQLGAIHAVLAHWAVSDEVATIVLPTGTGKTETMLGVLVAVRCPKLLVIVPSDALRVQLAAKFLSLGVLKASDCAVLAPTARRPIVCSLEHVPKTLAEAESILESAQVIVTTSTIAGHCSDGVRERLAEACPYLFIDEAHHSEAPTWREFKHMFGGRRILQFTATPFREDGKPLDGRIVFNYPLRKAQQENYFRAISFEPVVEFNPKKSDAAIAAAAIARLRADADKGHIVMARAGSVTHAREVFRLYEPFREFNPVQLHTGIASPAERERIRRQIVSGESRIVVCVDMLGEGFDLPELKIAAFHDIRKTLPVTLQLAGRFTRARSDLGHATFIANTADVAVQDELRALYARDPDWNVLLPDLSERTIGEQLSLQEFLRGFPQAPADIPLRSVRPATSAVVYHTTCAKWHPQHFGRGIPALSACERVEHVLNAEMNTLVVVTARRSPLKWAEAEHIYDWEWDLYVVFWWREKNLLFINSSTNSGEFKALAQAVAGQDVALVNGQVVFRAFAGVNRLRLQNVGLTEQLGRNVRYTGRMGTDVASAIPEIHRRKARKSVLSGLGYEAGERVSVGASRKGRIWSHRREHINELVTWCKSIGSKLVDPQIDPDEVLQGTLTSEHLSVRPRQMPISVDWPEQVYSDPEAQWSVHLDGRELSFDEVALELVNPSSEGDLRFSVVAEDDRVEILLFLLDIDGAPSYRFEVETTRRLEIGYGSRKTDAASFFYERPPIIWFADGSSLEGNEYVELRHALLPYDAEKIVVWDWSDTDIRVESQGKDKNPRSIQAKVIRELKLQGYDVIVDDDGKGEAADVVAIRIQGEKSAPSGVHVDFYHCKYSHGPKPGHRLEDLYELCGQAQKSISWMSKPDKKTDVFTHLLRRESRRMDAGEATRMEVGDNEVLLSIREMSRLCVVTATITIVQPGLSRSGATPEQLLLMSAAETYLSETFQLPFQVVGSE